MYNSLKLLSIIWIGIANMAMQCSQGYKGTPRYISPYEGNWFKGCTEVDKNTYEITWLKIEFNHYPTTISVFSEFFSDKSCLYSSRIKESAHKFTVSTDGNFTTEDSSDVNVTLTAYQSYGLTPELADERNAEVLCGYSEWGSEDARVDVADCNVELKEKFVIPFSVEDDRLEIGDIEWPSNVNPDDLVDLVPLSKQVFSK